MASVVLFLISCISVVSFVPSAVVSNQRHHRRTLLSRSETATESSIDDFQSALQQTDVTKICKVRLQSSSVDGLGLFATGNIKKGDVVLSIPHDDRFCLTPQLARELWKDIWSESYNGWTGDVGLLALLLLNEVARTSGKGTHTTKRDAKLQAFMDAWVSALPDKPDHPLLWSEDDQEILQSSSTNKIYRKLDDLEDDFGWLLENALEKDRDRFPATVERNGVSVDCFNLAGFKWAMALALSRSYFVDGSLRLLPIFDFFNHDDDAQEVQLAYLGAFGTTKGAQLVADRNYQTGDEVFCSYGPKSAADYLLEHGFCPEASWKTAVSEISFEVDPTDRFYDDKLDILEFETYEQAPMDPVQSFDLVAGPGRDGAPDPAMTQFVRLLCLGGTDAFLLESIFRKDVWGFMALPVSENNELQVVNAIVEACQVALEEFKECSDGGPEVCTRLRESETKALLRTVEYLQREKEALDLKEYYQERRLKDLGLDSEWAPEDDINPDLGFGQTRAPGGADYDW